MEQNIGKLSALDKVQALKKEKEKSALQSIDMELGQLTQQKQELESSLASIRAKRLDNINGQRQAVKELKSSEDTENILDDDEVKADIFNDDDQELETLKTEENNIRQNIQELDAQIAKLQEKRAEVLSNVSEQQSSSNSEEELQQEEKQVEGEKVPESQESTLEQSKKEQTQSVEEKTEAQENKDKKKRYEQKLQEILSFEVRYPELMNEPITFLRESMSENKIIVSFPERVAVNSKKATEAYRAAFNTKEKIQKLGEGLRSSKKWYQSEQSFNKKKDRINQELDELQKKVEINEGDYNNFVAVSTKLEKFEVLDMSQDSDFSNFQFDSDVRGAPRNFNRLKDLMDKVKKFYTKKIENHQ